jgi:hypothetical protein
LVDVEINGLQNMLKLVSFRLETKGNNVTAGKAGGITDLRKMARTG